MDSWFTTERAVTEGLCADAAQARLQSDDWKLLSWRVWLGVQRPTVAQVVAVDPSEAVRSADILPVLERSFEIVYRANLGGTLLQFLLADIVGNFRIDVAHDAALIQFLILFEEILIAEKIIPSDFVMVVARPHPG
ncbi:MAG TPA: hypothetical protein VM818_00135 [Vicinamibacterales bacterium]|nr:hypothetical protein [Vicinamibacterales bacterium]